MRNDYEYCPCCQGSLERLYLDDMGPGAEFCLECGWEQGLECGWEQGQKVFEVKPFFKSVDGYKGMQKNSITEE